MGLSFHFCDRVENIEYISIYTNKGENTALLYVIFICDIILHISKKINDVRGV